MSKVIVVVNADGSFAVHGVKGKQYDVVEVLKPTVPVAEVKAPAPVVAGKLVCSVEGCGKELSAATLEYLGNNKHIFNGALLCYAHQKDAKAARRCKVCNRVLTKKELDYVGIHLAGEMLCINHQKSVKADDLKCTECGVTVDRKVYDYSNRFYKKTLCRDHQSKAKVAEQNARVTAPTVAPAVTMDELLNDIEVLDEVNSPF